MELDAIMSCINDDRACSKLMIANMRKGDLCILFTVITIPYTRIYIRYTDFMYMLTTW